MKFKSGDRWKNSKDELKYKTWRKNVFELNKRKKGLSKWYVCMKCKLKRKPTRILHAPPIKSWEKLPKYRYDKTNGIVMCKRCHYKFHKKYGFDALEKPELINEYIK